MRYPLTVISALVLAGCVDNGTTFLTDAGRVSVRADPNLARFQPVTVTDADGRLQTIDPFPRFGGLVVDRLGVRPLTLEDRDVVVEVLTAYCGGRMPDDLSLRGNPGAWSSAPCQER